jgi:hypothetical protein
MTDIDPNINGIVIPRNPRTMAFDTQDHFLEGLGMERLYSAIVHMESRPCFLRHIFHALGRICNESSVECSNTTIAQATSPPVVVPRYGLQCNIDVTHTTVSMMAETSIPWLTLRGDKDHVMSSLDELDNSQVDEHSDVHPRKGVEMSGKRKRTTSHNVMPKVHY